MRLEKLELHGFKSFADKTEFVIQPGLTAFIGPNGCGKSNVVDSVKWVLGEQSVKALRGNEMQDVIFNGTPSRRSRGCAEVTLTLTNTKGILPTDYETVSVTRRLYRSGESEYFLNKQRCRLRDIRELFMDTGIGMDAYSIIEQGKVEILLTSNKQDRRAIFEEAAGISKYKAQKRVCLSKLDRVDTNLTRLTDIIDEVEKRMRSVKYQAAKARRWKRLDDQKRELVIALALHQYDLLVQDRDATAQQLAALRSETGQLHAAIERMEAELSEFETAVIEADQKVARLESEDIRINSQLQAAEDAVRMNEQRITELDDREKAAQQEIAETGATLKLMRVELDQSGTDITELEKAITEGESALAERRAAAKQTDEQVHSLRRDIEDRRAQALDLASEGARHKNELSSIIGQREQILRQDRRLAERVAEHRQSLSACETEKEQLAEKRDQLAAQIAAQQRRRDAAEHERDGLGRQHAEISDTLSAKHSEKASVSSRWELLGDLEKKLEGVSAGVRHLLEASGGDDPQVAGLCGVIADAIEVDIEHAAAVEAALSPHGELVVTDSFAAMTEAIDFLAQGEKGKASFLPLEAIDEPTVLPDEHSGHPDVVGRAIDLVRHPESLRKAIRYLLGDVLVVRDIRAARQLAATNGQSVRYATLDGQLLDPRGISVGGAARGAPGVISRRSELRALEVQRASLEADEAVLEKQLEENAERTARAAQTIHGLAAQLGRTQAELADVRAGLGRLDAFSKRVQSELEAGESERAENASLVDTLNRQEAEAREEARRIGQAEAELKERLAGLQSQRAEAESRRDRLQAEAAELGMAQAGRLEKKEALRRRIDELRRQLAEQDKRLEAARTQAQDCILRRRQAAETILEKKKDIQGLLERRGKLGTEKAEAGNRKELVRVQFDSKREERNGASRRAKEADAKLNELTVHASEIAMKIETLEGRTNSQYECSLAERRQQGEVAERDWEETRREIESVNQKIKAMGSVNTYAIEELEELQTRAAELRDQREDLERAERTLKDIIRKINRRSREMFRTTFEDVRENFQILFRKLFGGGRAEIVLEEEVDILDAGIDVIACPPGKEPSSITLLSGGEKAMTAVALLFAIFRSKPSPFCILDEVDAALDESNIDRFTGLVREFLQDSQFIVITHSRRTMAMADALYGITMQEPGVSTQVSVTFSDENEIAAAG